MDDQQRAKELLERFPPDLRRATNQIAYAAKDVDGAGSREAYYKAVTELRRRLTRANFVFRNYPGEKAVIERHEAADLLLRAADLCSRILDEFVDYALTAEQVRPTMDMLPPALEKAAASCYSSMVALISSPDDERNDGDQNDDEQHGREERVHDEGPAASTDAN